MAQSILTRFKDIMAANINALLDRAEDPEMMIDQYLRNMEKDLGAVKAETAAVMANESSLRRSILETEEEIKKMETYAKKALQNGSESEAKMFLEKRENQKIKLETLKKSVEIAENNALKMRQMYDKLNKDIGSLMERRNEIKTKIKVAKNAQAMAEFSGTDGSKAAFDAMEEKANQMMDKADAMVELSKTPETEMEELKEKYTEQIESPDIKQNVQDELERLKNELNS